MSKPERSKYCIFYPGREGNLIIREDIGVDDLGKIFKEIEAVSQENELFAFNMKGISQLSDIDDSPEKTFILITIKNDELTAYTEIGRAEAEELIAGAQHYYLIDDIYVVSDTALRQFLKEKK
ncbi:hypothetical protein [Desulfosporosinus sp. FKA]|uniref:hypothetical protein n=1 Tax=Desulfosporosinus sp. FKA TaxID=1969834 RepID=UPI000B49F346|nr:hypothetical protein [Desulfosporosinus sp. FKA]